MSLSNKQVSFEKMLSFIKDNNWSCYVEPGHIDCNDCPITDDDGRCMVQREKEIDDFTTAFKRFYNHYHNLKIWKKLSKLD